MGTVAVLWVFVVFQKSIIQVQFRHLVIDFGLEDEATQ